MVLDIFVMVKKNHLFWLENSRTGIDEVMGQTPSQQVVGINIFPEQVFHILISFCQMMVNDVISTTIM